MGEEETELETEATTQSRRVAVVAEDDTEADAGADTDAAALRCAASRGRHDQTVGALAELVHGMQCSAAQSERANGCGHEQGKGKEE
jgi:hypothetical protein